jgi:L,D-transpeptidase catalytic domain
MRLIRNAFAFLPALLLMANSSSSLTGKIIVARQFNIELPVVTAVNTNNCYAEWNLTASGLSEDAFNSALKGYNYLLQKKLLHNTSVLTVVDYSKPSSAKRLFVLDVNTGKVLFKTFVAHGKNSGLGYANSFSNEEESYKTSLGFFITNNTYNGSNGYSLKLKGCEKGINDKAEERAIVIHGAQYANEDFLQSNGYLGRSYGCPAVPEKMSKQIIDVIKNGSCLFLYHPTKKYINASKILNS